MKLVTFASFKGGAGKSTALMAAVPGLLGAGKRLALLEADENDTLALWRTNARRNGAWDEAVILHEATDLGSFEASYAAAERSGADIALVDSKGGASELNTAILAASDLILIPTSLTTIDIDGALSTFQFVLKLLNANGLNIPVAMMMTRFPTYRLNASERESVEILKRVPQLTAQLPLRNAFAEIQALGMLHLHAARLREAGSIAARHIEIALREANVVSQDILETLYEVEPTEALHADQTA
jgi:cellulose biosynthesis protein BcsQ